jgi:hypothetical protein
LLALASRADGPMGLLVVVVGVDAALFVLLLVVAVRSSRISKRELALAVTTRHDA